MAEQYQTMRGAATITYTSDRATYSLNVGGTLHTGQVLMNEAEKLEAFYSRVHGILDTAALVFADGSAPDPDLSLEDQIAELADDASAATWGEIDGTLASQGDLVAALAAKLTGSTTEVAFAALPVSPVVGQVANVSNSNTAVWGATVAGSGTDHVLARWNGTNWTVVGI